MEEQTEQIPTERDAIAEWTAELAQLLDADPVNTAAAIALHRQIADAYTRKLTNLAKPPSIWSK